jgi:hypothetical protein
MLIIISWKSGIAQFLAQLEANEIEGSVPVGMPGSMGN